jgi:hypothetical protein
VADRALNFDAVRCRVFFLELPPLSEKVRRAAVVTALRHRIADPTNSECVLATNALPSGLWCAVVTQRGHAPAPEDIVVPALAPWQKNTMTWVRDAAVPFAISPRGESVAVEANEVDLPDEIVRFCTYGATQLSVVGSLDAATRARWEAQLGISVQSVTPQRSQASAVRWSSPFSLATTPTRAQPVATTAAWVACVAGAAHAVFAGWEWVRARNDAQATQQAISQLAAKHNQTPDAWRTWIAKTAPDAARDGVSNLLVATMPALASTSHRVTQLNVEPKALSIGWSALSDAERVAFERAAHSQGVGVIASGKRARVVWP